MANAADFANAITDWVRKNIGPMSGSNFYQTRHTQTPGVSEIQPEGVGAEYNSSTNPLDKVKASGLQDALKQQLMDQWKGVGKGFITSSPALSDPKLLVHEQLHQIFDKGGLATHAQDIVPFVDPGILNYLKSSPIYPGIESNPTALANEGMAYDLTAGPNADLKANIIRMLANKPKETKNFQELTK